MSDKVNIFVGTPCYGSMLTEEYFHSILELQNFCRREEIGLNIQTLGQESLVTRARNTLVANFLAPSDTEALNASGSNSTDSLTPAEIMSPANPTVSPRI